jgi:hypothetical protein
LFLLLLCGVLGAQDNIAGTYKGKWTGMSAGGDFTLRLEKAGDDWKAAVQFSFADNPIPTQVKAIRVTGTQLETTYEFELGGNKLQSQLQAEVRNGQLTGKYRTKAVMDGTPVDEGTCEAKKE